MKNDKLKIGISYTDWRLDEYIAWLKTDDINVDIIVLSYETGNIEDLKECDGLVLSGGKDVNPEIYGKADEISLCGKILPERDEFEIKLIETALEKEIPILGICRGQQIVNTSPQFAGSLHCDIPSIKGIKCLEHLNQSPEGPRHKIMIEKNTFMFDIMGSEQIEVNSFHHQSVDKIGKGLRVSSHAPDGIIESLEWENLEQKPLLILVQWHPERLVEEKSSKLLLNYFYNRIKTKRN